MKETAKILPRKLLIQALSKIQWNISFPKLLMAESIELVHVRLQFNLKKHKSRKDLGISMGKKLRNMLRHVQQAFTKARDSQTGLEPAWLQELGLPKLPPKKLPKSVAIESMGIEEAAPRKTKRAAPKDASRTLKKEASDSKEQKDKSDLEAKTDTSDSKEKKSDKNDKSDSEHAEPRQEALYAKQEGLYKFDFNLENLKLVRKEKGKVPEVSVEIKLNHSSDDDHPLARFDDGMIHPCKQITVREYKDLVLHGGKDGAKPSRKVWTGLHSKGGDVYVGHREDWGPLIIIVHGGRYKVSTRADAFNSSVSETRKNS